VDQAEFRRLMGFWATGVSLVTAMGSDGPFGATANSLTSLSLDPPLLLVCFDLEARTLVAVRESGRFCVNVLSAEQEQVSRRFARKSPMEEKFAELPYRVEDGVPVLEQCLATVVCRVEQEFEAGDHVIVVGAPVAGGIDEELHPLIFYRGGYWERVAERAAVEPARPDADVALQDRTL
jgi:3-hydroxy-9,10-secoandrosta-1,3,5(10)-triene-9,17-dione monooxygenase reductase component